MQKLYAAVTALILVWSVSMSFFALSAFDNDWIWAIVGLGVLIVFAGLGGLLMPPARLEANRTNRRATFWFTQFFGTVITTELLVAALVAWVMGNRTLSANNAYQTLGLIIFLALLAVGQGVPATFVFFLAKRSQQLEEQVRSGTQLATVGH